MVGRRTRSFHRPPSYLRTPSTHVYIYIYMYMCVYIYIYIYIHIHHSEREGRGQGIGSRQAVLHERRSARAYYVCTLLLLLYVCMISLLLIWLMFVICYFLAAQIAGAAKPAPAPRCLLPVPVKRTLLLGEPLPCNPAAETALQPLLWCSESYYSSVYHFPEE